MTCIVAVASQDNEEPCVMAGDSQSLSNLSASPQAGSKVWADEGFMYGVSGDWRLMHLLRYAFKAPAHMYGVDNHEYMCIDWVDELRKVLKERGAVKIDNSFETLNYGCVVVIYRRTIYCVDSDLQVTRPAYGYYAAGSGADVALGALYATDLAGIEPSRERASIALAAAERYNAGVRAPFTFVQENDNGTVEEWQED